MKTQLNLVAGVAGLVLLLGATGASGAEGSKIYWTEFLGNVVMRANLDGSDPEVVVSDAAGAAPMAVDPGGQAVVWGDFRGSLNRHELCAGIDGHRRSLLSSSQEGFVVDDRTGDIFATGVEVATMRGVYRAEADGSSLVQLVNTGTVSTRGIAGDFESGHVYYAADNGTIGRVNLDGSNHTTILGGMGNPNGLAVDTVNGHLYFSRTDGPGSLHRANLDGSGVTDIVTGPEAKATSIDLDVSRATIYWTGNLLNCIKRSDFDGSNVGTLIDGLEAPISLALLLDYRRGTVNSGAGRVSEVLRVNGSTGSGNGLPTVRVGAGESITVCLDAAPAGPDTDAAYTLYLWPGGTADSMALQIGPSVLGTVANPTPLQPTAFPQARFALRGGLPPVLTSGVRELPAPSGAPWSLVKSDGLGIAGSYLLQAVLEDAGACNSARFSTSNTIRLVIE